MKPFTSILLLITIVGSLPAQSVHDILSTEEKIYSLSKIWQEVNYNFAFIDQLDFDFDSLYQLTIPQIIAAKDNFEYINILRRFMRTLDDGHTGIMVSQFYWDEGDYPPLFLDLKEDRFYVQTIHEEICRRDPTWI